MRQPLTPLRMRAELRRTLPRRNAFGVTPALMDEARRFGVNTRAQFRGLLLRHRRALIEADREPLDDVNQRMFRSEMGAARFLDLIRRQRWFSWEALTRLALEFEFGDEYRRFVNARDQLPEDH
jgi:anti-sigma factor RsiW